mmetsp:Transcript_36059/g.66491  ORF Transcript_36059/g.66491 Transcript_36059/m.66491 type:complete len:112 (+) Transcript_36059:1094-1429(+)
MILLLLDEYDDALAVVVAWDALGATPNANADAITDAEDGTSFVTEQQAARARKAVVRTEFEKLRFLMFSVLVLWRNFGAFESNEEVELRRDRVARRDIVNAPMKLLWSSRT